jgi:DNA polymerase I-like protein with 3'-5' exonuclease and polymerase domains
MYVEVSEIDRVVAKVKEVFEHMFEEFKGIPLTVDMKLGDYYKEGEEL